ncbi:MAG TPA: hypothetical protein PLO93_06690, partial [Candidatus Omnitrophota bacterium]|nr:hypothetical protein [Candidatus Omnitrophota bacterium]
GFTLIELLLVVVFVGVLAGLSVPHLPKHYTRLQLQQAADHIGYLMRYAQSAAITGQREYQICFYTTEKTYVLQGQNVADEHDPKRQDLSESFSAVQGDKGQIFKLPNALSWEIPDSCVRFYPNGVIDQAIVSLTIEQGQSMVVSTQEQRGRVNVFAPDQE